MTVTPGARLGRYELRSLLGSGGMGEVYLAYDRDLERDVAVKVLNDEAVGSSSRVRRFVQEAKAASALNHPNVATVYEIGSDTGFRFIAMELVLGKSLRDRLGHGAMPFEEVVAVSTQIAAGLAAAHQAGIVHRDIKPENIIIRPDGYAKVLDFGLAKLREMHEEQVGTTLLRTGTGVTMGTPGYMAPEQLTGGNVTAAADVFSLGVVLYEMISGRRPFEGTTSAEIATAILTKTPRPLDAPPKLRAIVMKALARDPDERYATAGAVLEDLRHISGPAAISAPRSLVSHRYKTLLLMSSVLLLIIMIVAAAWVILRSSRSRRAEASVAAAERLLKEYRYSEAYDSATEALAVLPNEQRLRDVIAKASVSASFESNPRGAAVFLETYNRPTGRVRAGITPLTIAHLPLADYLVTFEKEGYATAKRPLPQYPIFFRGEPAPAKPARVAVKLIELARVPPEMVAVEGGDYTLAGWWRASDRTVRLRDFLIDRYEVSNHDYEAFVRDGGYRRPELWKTIAFEHVQKRFRDTTGLPGPRSWSGGASPAGRENHPVTDVTWHEASAFALWKGKQLPSIYQWEKAARYPLTRGIAGSFPWGLLGQGIDATERMNFNGRGTMPVDGMPFGISPYGAHHMAGNVSEWTRNPLPPGFAVRGGSWNDALYTFGRTGALPAGYASPEVGFRCVMPLQGDGRDQGEFALSATGFAPTYQPVDDKTYQEIAARYDYPKTPVKARVVERLDQGDWMREKIEYEVNGSVVPAYLYLPKNYRRPLQVVHYSPAGDVYSGWRSVPQSIEISLAPVIRGGRAVFAVVMPGFIGRSRPPGFEEPDTRSAEYVDYTARQMVEMRRGIDYLETRPDIDRSRIAFYAQSAGSWEGLILAAVEKRYRSILLIGTGIDKGEVTDTPAANRINFAPRISGPKLMFQGRYDESAPLQSEAEPLFRLMREPKRLETFEGGHVPALSVAIPKMTAWFDETLGKVQ
jgi:serine/threonine protein kinase/formylglycine-generating enzyme required for sulfatase activity